MEAPGACYPRKIWKFKYSRMQSGAIWMLKFSKQQHFIAVNKVKKKLNDLFLAQRKNLSNVLSLLRTEAESSLTGGTTRSFLRHTTTSFNPRSVSVYLPSWAVRVCSCCSNQLLSRSSKYILSCSKVTFSQVKIQKIVGFWFLNKVTNSF